MKVKKTEYKLSPSILACCKDSRPCSTESQYRLDALVTQDQHLCLTHLLLLVSEVCCIPVDWKSKCNHFDCHILEIEVDFSSPELCSG